MLKVNDLGYWYDRQENSLFEHVNLEFKTRHVVCHRWSKWFWEDDLSLTACWFG